MITEEVTLEVQDGILGSIYGLVYGETGDHLTAMLAEERWAKAFNRLES
jgi:hypothetical protein